MGFGSRDKKRGLGSYFLVGFYVVLGVGERGDILNPRGASVFEKLPPLGNITLLVTYLFHLPRLPPLFPSSFPRGVLLRAWPRCWASFPCPPFPFYFFLEKEGYVQKEGGRWREMAFVMSSKMTMRENVLGLERGGGGDGIGV